jgi:hypothetical protein
MSESNPWSNALLLFFLALGALVGSYLSIGYFLSVDFGGVAIAVMGVTGLFWILLGGLAVMLILRRTR